MIYSKNINMVIRTFQKQRNIKKTLGIIGTMIVGIFLVAKLSNTIYEKIAEKNANQTFVVGTTINFAGEIESENNFPLYTHKISNKQGNTIFLKSSSINLNSYSGKLEIFGEIKDIRKDIPIIEVSALKFIDQGLIIKNNIYFFVKDLLYLDFWNQPQLSARKEKKEIQIFYEKQKVSSIERFLCSRVLRQRDCTYLIEDYSNNQKENFDSYRWYTYYKHGTGLRTVFDQTMFWYVFKDIEEETMLNLSTIIRIVDKKFIISNKRNVIKEACSNKWEDAIQVENSIVQYDDNNQVHVSAKSSKTEKTCKVTFDMRNERAIVQTEIL